MSSNVSIGLRTLATYKRRWLVADILGGLTVAALLVPEGMAYAQLAGVPPAAAFYGAPIGLVLYALLGTSRQLVVAVSGAIAVLSGTIVGEMADPGSEEFIALTAALAITAGLIAMVAGALRFGRIAQFFSESVLTGFIFGLALVISVKQLPKMFGIESEDGDFFERLWGVIIHLGDTNATSLVIGASTLLGMLLLERYFERLPAALVALVVGIAIGEIFDVAAKNDVEVLGDVPSGLAGPAIPDIAASEIGALILGGLAITIVAFAEAVGPAKSFAAEHGYKIDVDQELVGIGAANVGAGFFQGFSIGSSLSKSAANNAAGTHSSFALIVAAAVTALVALFLTDTLTNLPEPTLGAIVLVAISGMYKIEPMRRLWRLRKLDFWLAAAGLFGVLVFDALPGLAIAVVLSLGLLILQAADAHLDVLGRRRGSPHFVSIDDGDEVRTIPGMMLARPDGPLFFANASSIREAVVELIETGDEKVSNVVLDLSATVDLDVPTADELLGLAEDLRSVDIQLTLVRVDAAIVPLLESIGMVEAVGAEHIVETREDAIALLAIGDQSEPLDLVSSRLSELAAEANDPVVRDRLRRAAKILDDGA